MLVFSSALSLSLFVCAVVLIGAFERSRLVLISGAQPDHEVAAIAAAWSALVTFIQRGVLVGVSATHILREQMSVLLLAKHRKYADDQVLGEDLLSFGLNSAPIVVPCAARSRLDAEGAKASSELAGTSERLPSEPFGL